MTGTDGLQYLRPAQERIAEEQTRLRAERDAFNDFRSQITDLNPEPAPQASQTQATGSVVLSKGKSTMLKQVRTAYRKTVMDVPHYTEDYNELLPVNMSKELGTELSKTVTSGQQFTIPLKKALLESSQIAAENRTKFLRKISQEATAIQEAKTALDELEKHLQTATPDFWECSYDELVTLWDELYALEKEYAGLCSKRQSQLQRRQKRMRLPDDMPTLCVYLYKKLPVTYPILSDSLDRIEHVRSERKHAFWLLTHLD
jgi:hypothetical protein